MGLQDDGIRRDGVGAPEPVQDGEPAGDLARENAELRRQLHEARSQQQASAEILKVMTRSAFDLQAVLDAIVETARRLCQCDYALV
ncbi:MAG: hypothetical protein KIT81_18075, partial [Alphaproteobacteria bacterium]|nr:hypothetical protein [Alphaproteobacteria bacterium]